MLRGLLTWLIKAISLITNGLSQIQHSLAGVCDIHLALPIVYHIQKPTDTPSNTYILTAGKILLSA